MCCGAFERVDNVSNGRMMQYFNEAARNVVDRKQPLNTAPNVRLDGTGFPNSENPYRPA
jgi:hypothetical protein